MAGGAICSASDQFNPWRMNMTSSILAIRVAAALLAVGATVASAVVLQFALLVG
jgi:hypothetical protein